MTKQEIKKRIKELEKNIRCEKSKMNVCAYGKSDLIYLYGLEEELTDLNNKLKAMEE